VVHGTGSSEGGGEAWSRVEELLAGGSYRLKQRYENNNGLAVLDAVLLERFRPHGRVTVTGPQRSGTTFAAFHPQEESLQ
jgi:hypothetical protein